MEPEPKSIEIPRGRAWSETWQFLDDEDAATNLTGCTGELLINAGGATLATGTFTPGATVGEAVLALTEEDVAAMDGHRVGHWVLLITDTLDTVHEARGTVWMQDEG